MARQWHQTCSMDWALWFPSFKVNIKIAKKNWCPLDGPDQNHALQFVKDIINCKKQSIQTLIIFNSIFKKSTHKGESDLNI